MIRVVKTDGLLPVANEDLAVFHGMNVDLIDRECLTEDALIDACSDAEGMLVIREPVNARVISELKRCKVITVFGVGLDAVDVKAATAAGIVVANVPDANVKEVSSHAVAMMLHFTRRLGQFNALVREGNWNSMAIARGMKREEDMTLGLIGFGRIGKLVAKKTGAFGFKIQAFDPQVSGEEMAALGVSKVELDALINSSDIVSLHVPFSAANSDLIDRRAIGNMRPGAVLINVSRGGLIDEGALAEALISGHLAGAGLDAFRREPMPQDDPLLRCPNTIFSPHAGYSSNRSTKECVTKAFANVAAVLKGDRAPYQVNNA